jgi:Domain of unknown function (DUF5615)
VIRGLRQRGVDVLTVPEAGMLGASDEDHLTLAKQQGRVVVTYDEDFLRLAASTPDHAGIVHASRQLGIGAFLSGLMLIYQVLEAKDMVGHVEYL